MTEADRSYLPLPLAIDEIDRQWLTAALRTSFPDVTVRDFAVVDSQRGACTKLRLRLEMDEAGQRAGVPETVILKGGFEPHSREMYRMHDREVRGYRDVFPVLKLPTPACYFAENDPERLQGIVIMEDLVRRGVTFCHPLEPQGFEAVARRLTVLARHHGQTWDSPEFAPGGRWAWLTHVSEASRKTFGAYLAAGQWERFVNSPRGAAASVRFHGADWAADVLDRLVTFSGRLPHVIVHGDTHLGNLYVDRDGAPGFFDSLPGRSPAMEEVSYHVAGALDVADRRRWEEPLVQHYLAELRAAGVEAPAFDEAMRQYAVFLARGYIVFLCNEAIFQPEAINTAYVARFSKAMIDHDTAALIAGVA